MLAIAGIVNPTSFDIKFIFNVKGHHSLKVNDDILLGVHHCKIANRKDDDGEAYFTAIVTTTDPTFVQKGYAMISVIGMSYAEGE